VRTYGLLGRDAGSVWSLHLHLLGLRLVDFLGRHFEGVWLLWYWWKMIVIDERM
jgi:hypothetical protein